jgi:tetratricopeptide (TPR) repeat protein
VLVVIWIGVPCLGHADDAPSDESYIQRGIALRLLGKNSEALDAFEQAYVLRPTPRAGAQMAVARQALGDWVGAERGLEKALRASNDPWIARYSDALEQALAMVRTHLGWLHVATNVTDGELLLNGLPDRGLAVSEPRRVLAGTLEIEVRATGYVPIRRRLEIAPGAETDVVVALQAAPTPGAVAFAAPNAQFDSTPRNDARHPTAAYVALAAAGVLAVTGVIAWRLREDNVAIYNDDSRCRVGPLTRAERCGGRARTADIAFAVETGAFAVGIVSAALGASLLWATGPRSSRIAGASCALSAALGIVCTGQF